ncbi:MAG: hypothetical protein EDM03_13440 [Porphyrobacter sp. IPPAS B-1204]|nr:MAG: hypothetical protein EDM03_13440 [Porphyrobacter sp. IPPAS B-1204]
MRAIVYDFDNAPHLTQTDAYMTLSRKDVLGIVQSAFDELGPDHPEFIAIKREVLAQVSDGKLAHALRAAIIGAGQARCTDNA